MFQSSGNHSGAAHDKLRAESLYQWALEAAEATNTAGHGVLRPELEQLRTEIDSFELSKGVSAP